MKKLVNGKVVNIKNIELFELAAEGLALQNTTTSATKEGIESVIDSELVSKYIKEYDIFFRSMPYPLYAVESDIKYVTLGVFIKALSSSHIDMWVDKGLHINLDKDTGMTLKIVNNTWSIEYNKEPQQDNISLSLFNKSIGYNEYSWVLNKIINNEKTNTFYEQFMPEFVKACNNDPMILKWELENILTFSNIPKKIELRPNRIIDFISEEEYMLDIFCTGTSESTDKVQSLSLINISDITSSYKKIRTYGFESYVKHLSGYSNKKDKIVKKSIVGLQNLFNQLCAIKNAKDISTFPTFYGIIQDSNLIFIVDNKLYISKSNRIESNKDIAHGIQFYSIENNKVYFTKSKKVNNKISKDTLYCYNISDGLTRVCKIIFTY